MAEYYISPTGDDSTGDGSEATPWLTINRAVTGSVAGDTIILKDGTYPVAGNSIFSNERVYTGESTPNVIIDGEDAVVGLNFAVLGNNIVINNIKFTNMKPTTTNGIFGVDCTGGGSITFNNCIFKNLNTQNREYYRAGLFALYTMKPSDLYFNACLFDEIKKLYPTTIGSSVYGSIFNANSSGGIIAIRLNCVNCTFIINATGNEALDCVVLETSTILTGALNFTNCILKDDTGTSTKFSFRDQDGWYDISNCCIHGFSNVPTSTDSITDDPLFVDSANGNFNLRPSSPCIGTGKLV